MRKRAGLILKLGCYVLAALVVYQLASRAARWRRVSVTIPELPTLSDAQPAKGTNLTSTATPAKATNLLQAAAGTNSASSTNFASTNAAKIVAQAETNSAPRAEAAKTNSNAVATNPHPELEKDTTVAAPVLPGSNGVPVVSGTNVQAMLAMAGTNSGARPPEKGTNTPSPSARDMAMAGSNPRSSPARKPADVPPEIKARIDRIIESEIMGQVVRPQPMALIGIAGNSAIIRTPSGQTGLVKEGDELGGVKLVQVGINRVLVEEQGQKKELTIFSGFGSESLLSKQKESRNESTNK